MKGTQVVRQGSETQPNASSEISYHTSKSILQGKLKLKIGPFRRCASGCKSQSYRHGYGYSAPDD